MNSRDVCVQTILREFSALQALWLCTIRIDIYNFTFTLREQELNYRQQIARQLSTRYAEGICRHKYYTVTLKSKLIVTQGHWKRNHWIVVVELFDVEYYCDLEMWVTGH